MKSYMTIQRTMTIRTGLLRSALALTVLISLTGCGGSKTDSVAAAKAPAVASANYLKVTRDDYGLLTPNFYYSTNNASFWSIQANVADGIYDQNFRCVIRIDVPKTENGMIELTGKTYSIGDDPRYEKFPGEFYVFNGHASVYKKVEQGMISFSADSDETRSVTGTFDVTVTDYDSKLVPTPQYVMAGEFSITVESSGPANPLPAEVYPAVGKETYDGSCASCHGLGEYDQMAESAPDLSMRGGELPMVYDPTAVHHQAITLDEQAMAALRVFVNAW